MKLYGTGNNTNHGGRLQLIDGGAIGAGLRIGTAGDSGYALHLTSDSAAKPSTSAWTVTSDGRTKENLRPFHTGLDVLRQIVLQTWEYNGLGVNYHLLFLSALNAIKELDARTAALEAQSAPKA